jgi:hypothetical protein
MRHPEDRGCRGPRAFGVVGWLERGEDLARNVTSARRPGLAITAAPRVRWTVRLFQKSETLENTLQSSPSRFLIEVFHCAGISICKVERCNSYT